MTIGDVLRANQDFLFIRGLGIAGFQELEEKVAQIIAHADNASSPAPGVVPLLTAVDPACLSIGMIPPAVQSLPIARLHLGTGVHRTLIKAGITTICALYHIDRQQIENLPELFPLECINAALISLARSVREKDIDWFEYCRLQSIQMLPSDLPPKPSIEQLVGVLPHVVEEVLNREYGSRAWLIFQSRFTLAGLPERTFADLAREFALSRERIRQLEESIFNILSAVFIEQRYTGRDYHIHPEIHRVIESIYKTILSMPSMPFQAFTEAKLLDCLRPMYDVDILSVTSFLEFLFPLIGVELIKLENAYPIFVKGNVTMGQRKTLQKAITYMDYFLTRQHPYPCTETEILAYVNEILGESERISSSQLSILVDICLSAEKCDSEKIQGKFACLWGSSEQAERILAEAGQPMSTEDIAQEINRRLEAPGYQPVAVAHLRGLLANDTSFVALGRDDRWGLKTRTYAGIGTVLALIEEFLTIRNKPATVREIFAYVSEQRPVGVNTIYRYLSQEQELFKKINRTDWGLRKWSHIVPTEVSYDWTRKRVADFVASIFHEYQAEELDYKLIKQALMKAVNINGRQAQGLLRWNPVMKTQLSTRIGEYRAVFQPDYPDRLSQTVAKFNPISRRRHERQQIEEKVYALLEAVPNKQMLLSDLIMRLHGQLGWRLSSIYRSIAAMNSIELLESPNSNARICRLI
ncbi:MAG: sigma factor-like helix-turn-helix DNA-binding protein [Ktedonobacteraceae bacterium]